MAEPELERQAAAIREGLEWVARATRGRTVPVGPILKQYDPPWTKPVVHKYSFNYATSAARVLYFIEHDDDGDRWLVTVQVVADATGDQLHSLPDLGSRRPSIDSALRQQFRHDAKVNVWLDVPEGALYLKSGWILQNWT